MSTPSTGRAPRERDVTEPRGARNLIAAASFVILVAGLKAASGIMVPFLVALFISVLSMPVMNWLRKRGFSAGFAVLITITVDIAMLAMLLLVVSNSVNELVRERSKYEARGREFVAGVEQQVVSARTWFEEHGISTENWFPPGFGARTPNGSVNEQPENSEEMPTEAGGGPASGLLFDGADPWLALFDLGALVDAANRTVRGVANVLANALIVVIITTFVLLEAATFPKKLRRAFGNSRAQERFSLILSELRRYLSVKTAISVVTGLIVGIWVALLGVDFAPLWGLLAFALNYIPNLGSIIAAGPPVLLALVQQGFGLALLVASGYLVVNVVVGNFIEPQVMGRRLGLSTLVVFLSLVFWGWVWGPVGMLLSVPLTMVVKILLENSRDFRWIAVVMEGPERRSKPTRRAGPRQREPLPEAEPASSAKP